MNIIIRTDSSKEIGTGHVYRCLSLADLLRDRGADIEFVCRKHDGNLVHLIESRGFIVHKLPKTLKKNIKKESIYKSWLGDKWSEDAKETKQIIIDRNLKVNWLIIDHYGIDSRYENILLPVVEKIFVIDDLANRKHSCNALLDQNLVFSHESRYFGLTPSSCELFLGPRYAILNSAYSKYHNNARIREGKIRRILVFFGALNDTHLLDVTIQTILFCNQNITIDVLLSNSSENNFKIINKYIGNNKINFHINLPNLAQLMEMADFSIGAVGTTTWERLCLGLPTAAVAIAANQQDVAKNLHDKGLIHYLGNIDNINTELYTQTICNLISVPLERAWSERCLEQVDGKGAQRIADYIMRN